MTDTACGATERQHTLWWWLPLYLAVASIVIFLRPPIAIESTRQLAVAWDMWAHQQFWVPHMNGIPYAEKAPLLYWLIVAGWAVFGVNDVWPRVLMVLIGSAQLILVQALARRLFPACARIARLTPWLLMGLTFSFLYGLLIMFEGLLAVWVLAAMLCLVSNPRRLSLRWTGFTICIGLGLLTKGPVMLVHTAPVWLLGPWWCKYAREHRVHWYGFGTLALISGCAILAAWAIPAVHASGSAYTDNLLYKQTGGRLVNAFIHQHPFWWYVPWAAGLLFPFVLWPRMWAAIVSLRPPLQPQVRMALAWLVPAFVVFSAISGKQSYYLIPELPAAVIVMAAAIANLRAREDRAPRIPWQGTWLLALTLFGVAVFLFALPVAAGAGQLHDHWLRDLAPCSAPFAVLYGLLGVFVLLPRYDELRCIATASLIGSAGAYALFAFALFPAFDMRAASQLLGKAAAEGRAVGNLEVYNGQFEFMSRMMTPIDQLYEGPFLQDWAARHPRGLVIAYPGRLTSKDLRYARLVQPYRGVWMVIWDAPTLAMLRRGQQPPVPTATILLPAADYWRYANVR
ncbi:MAG: glycosyltransferase family 39 protein [Nitrospira sp.]|nr:glycosyltransferase family 39 protein [Nitrospira sp.]